MLGDLCLLDVDHIHFYVHDSVKTGQWFMEKMGLQHLSRGENNHTHTEVVGNLSSLFLVFSSPLNYQSPVAQYLRSHPPGVVDVAFCVENLDSWSGGSNIEGVEFVTFPQEVWLNQKSLKFAKIRGWDSLHHTLIENKTDSPFCFFLPQLNFTKNITLNSTCDQNTEITGIDHLVLNVASGELTKALEFYQKIFGFELQQTFTIETSYSGLYSKALISQNSQVQFNINEPTSSTSQIQEFLEANNGAGIQHFALTSTNIIKTVRQMRHQGLSFLPIPSTYYRKLRQRGINGLIPSLTAEEWSAIATEQILVDCNSNQPESLLMQTFTKPMFTDKTFFVEIIERRNKAMGFGQGNFQELFEAVERDSIN